MWCSHLIISLVAVTFELLKIHTDLLIFACFFSASSFDPAIYTQLKLLISVVQLTCYCIKTQRSCQISERKNRSPCKESYTVLWLLLGGTIQSHLKQIFQSECYFSLLSRIPSWMKPMGRHYVLSSSEKKENYVLCLQSQDIQ